MFYPVSDILLLIKFVHFPNYGIRQYADAKSVLRLVELDAARLFGAGIIATRSYLSSEFLAVARLSHKINLGSFCISPSFVR